MHAALKFDMGLKIKSLLKCPFLNVCSKTFRPTKVNMLGNWEVSILFRNLWRSFFVFILGYPKLTPYVPKKRINVDIVIFNKLFP